MLKTRRARLLICADFLLTLVCILVGVLIPSVIGSLFFFGMALVVAGTSGYAICKAYHKKA